MSEFEESLPQGVFDYEGELMERFVKLDKRYTELNRQFRISSRREVTKDIFSDLVDRVEVSSVDSTFFGDLNPVHEEYIWYRGYLINKGKDGIIVLIPWQSPQETRPTKVLLTGEPDKQWVEKVLEIYLDYFEKNTPDPFKDEEKRRKLKAPLN